MSVGKNMQACFMLYVHCMAELLYIDWRYEDMIKVIASDMDGTLLCDDHRIAPDTIAAVKEACAAGIRFMVATGRGYEGAMAELDGTGIEESIIAEMQLFHVNMTREEVVKTSEYRRAIESVKVVSDFEEIEKAGIPVFKLFMFSHDLELVRRVTKHLEKNPKIAVASSFESNVEITDARAQKGPILKEYIESLGYTMDEVMVLGDSLNDYSMMSMDFGATVAMGNAVSELKKAAKYITKSNDELGVAYAIRELLKKQKNK